MIEVQPCAWTMLSGESKIQFCALTNSPCMFVDGKTYWCCNEYKSIDQVEPVPLVEVNKFGDAVNHPSHYTKNGEIECIDAIRASMTPKEFQGMCKGNVMKYIWRYRDKNGVEDLKKAKVYLDWLIESYKQSQYTEIDQTESKTLKESSPKYTIEQNSLEHLEKAKDYLDWLVESYKQSQYAEIDQTENKTLKDPSPKKYTREQIREMLRTGDFNLFDKEGETT